MNQFLRCLAGMAGLAAGFMSATVYAEAPSLERGSFEVDGRSLSFFCAGSGAPTLVLEAPSGISNAEAYANVLADLSRRARVCAYERAFYGRSDPLEPGRVQDVSDYSEELRQFLSLEQVPAPFILVGFSYGGFVSRHYAAHHPDDVAGMVLIDSPHVMWLRSMKQEMNEPDWRKVEDIMAWFVERRGHDVWESQFMVERAPSLPGDLPIAIIVRDQDHERMRESGISEAGFRIYNDLHFRLSSELARLSDRTLIYTAENTDHMIPDNDPDIVLEAVDEILSIARQPKAAEGDHE